MFIVIITLARYTWRVKSTGYRFVLDRVYNVVRLGRCSGRQTARVCLHEPDVTVGVLSAEAL